ncbi:MAG: hypothetical protein KF764_34610, partial [Labilithrix sp.]|nr:hypothetical protein [Labilithrix sp.]
QATAPTPPRAVSSADLAPLARRVRSSPDLQAEAVKAAAAETPSAAQATDSVDSLPASAEEQIFAVVRAALEASLLPLLEKQAQLEARLEWLNQAEQRAAAVSAAAVAAAPVAPAASRAPVLSLPKPFEIALNQTTVSDAPPSGGRASLVPTSYGFVIAPEGPLRRPSIELALENVGPIDVPDFGRGRRSAGSVLIALLVAGMFAAVTATILSYT